MRWYKEIFYIAWHFGLKAMWEIAICPRLFKSQKRSEGILSFLERVSKERMDELRLNTQHELGTQPRDCNIWVCWLQGEEKMPETIKKCYDSLLRNKGNHSVVLITNENLSDYVSLPNHIIFKHDKGIISNTHFSDIVRCYLLWKYGGIWIDAALYVTKEVDFHNTSFFTPKITNEDLINQKWTVGCLASNQGFYLFEFAYCLLIDYWKTYNKPIEYLLLDHVFLLAYRNNSEIKRIIDEIPLNNTDLHRSRYLFNEKCDEKVFQQMIKNNTFLSLTWRFNYETISEDGALTYYGRLLLEFEDKKKGH